MNLKEYLAKRHCKIKALTKKEATILGIPYPLRKGWAEQDRAISPKEWKRLCAVLQSRPKTTSSRRRTPKETRKPFEWKSVYP